MATRRVGTEKRMDWITERLSLPTMRLFLVRSGLIGTQRALAVAPLAPLVLSQTR